MKNYVLGFAFDFAKENIVLIEKQKPEWQKDKLNGVGGKMEGDENPQQSMVREFFEETGVQTNTDDWTHFATMRFGDDIMGGQANVYCFKMFDDYAMNASTCEEEAIFILKLDGIDEMPLMHNLHILIPLALQTEFRFTELKQNN